MIKINDKWFRILIILLPVVLCVYTYGLLRQPLSADKLGRFMVSFCCIGLICEGNRYIILHSRKWQVTNLHPNIRNWVVIFPGLAYTTLLLAGSSLLRKYISTGVWDMGTRLNSMVYINSKQLTIGIFGYSFLNALIYFFFLFICYELLHHYAKLRYTEKERERLEKEKLRAELQQLKGIVNPHFLFNNLNSLSALIVENPAQAEIFLDELTKVFRYLLRNNETELTTLANELQFIRSYYHLLRIRYGEGIHLQLQVEKEYDGLLIPPLTLQLLVENAVKHNRLHKENPLQIELYTVPGKKLIVRNNIAKKDSIVESTGIGLQNINARYRMLNREGVIIEQTDQNFSVIIPLIN